MQEDKICPYPGLRPFNDDESIFFKGRDHNIDVIIELFEKKKFMMLTGASGDGKSSLVYAGVVPQAKAGLFKAKYNNWAVADFRPERNPLGNLAHALNKFFGFEDQEKFEKELSYGFSSLIDIYKNSPLYINTENKEWLESDDAKKKQLKRKASNLLIIADQFEEFFTNAENYHNGIASQESQTVINLLLETTKMALAEDIPIYIICTMRSDYIGQCAAFRGLPEYIGFSQFFVPRLKRNEIQQVIEEPAQLNGDSLSRRLSERLLNDITDGYDQLPILQHALNQIWKMAGNGKEQMDLIHYAKVGGLPKSQLPVEDKEKFETWFEQLPEFKKQLFTHPSLENILNAHSNELFETAYDVCISKHPRISDSLTKERSKLIIKTTYQCLTKIDDARAVRNRMTIREITDIIAQPEIKSEAVGRILDIFRQQGNTFIKPFITDDPESLKTNDNTVLDITHESLIRNWDLLDAWAKEEYNNWLNFQDFNKQLQRWIDNGKDTGYLLPIGPLTFFEQWYNTCKPNKHWLARYDESEVPAEEKLSKANATLENANEFLRKSARRLFFSRTVVKYGANRIITWFGIFILICSCTYYYFDYREKQNDKVLEKINKRGVELLQSNKVKNAAKASFVINYERLNNNSFEELLKNNTNHDSTAFDIADKMFWQLQNYTDPDRDTLNPLVFPLLIFMDKHLANILNEDLKSTKKVGDGDLQRLNKLIKTCFFANNHLKNDVTSKIIKKNVELLDKIFSEKLQEPLDSLKPASMQFNESLQLLIALGAKNPLIDISYIVKKISPLESEQSKARFNKLYPKDIKWKVDWNNYLTHNGGYQLLAYAYAGCDYVNEGFNTDKIALCLDSIIAFNKDYKNYDMQGFSKIVGYLLKYQHFTNTEAEKLFKKYETLSGILFKKITEKNIEMVSNQKLYQIWRVFQQKDWSENIINYTLSYDERNAMWDFYQTMLTKDSKTSDDVNFQNALYFKKRGIFLAQHPAHKKESYECFTKAFQYYKNVSEKYLAQDFTIGTEGTPDSKIIKRSALFLYPALVKEQNTWEPFYIISYNNEILFGEYVVENNLINHYKTKEDLEYYNKFLYNYYNNYKISEWPAKRTNFNYSFYEFAGTTMKDNSLAREVFNESFLSLVAVIKAFEEKDTVKAMSIYKKLDQKKILSAEFQKESDPMGEVHKFLLKTLSKNLAVNNHIEKAMKTIYALVEPSDRRNLLTDIVYLLQEKGPIEHTFIYMDTLYKNIGTEQKFSLKLLRAMGIIGSQAIFNEASVLIKDVSDLQKPRALVNFISGVASTGLYYKAYKYIPTYVASTNELQLYNEVLHAEIVRKHENMRGWKKFENNSYGIKEDFDTENLGRFIFAVEEE